MGFPYLQYFHYGLFIPTLTPNLSSQTGPFCPHALPVFFTPTHSPGTDLVVSDPGKVKPPFYPMLASVTLYHTPRGFHHPADPKSETKCPYDPPDLEFVSFFVASPHVMVCDKLQHSLACESIPPISTFVSTNRIDLFASLSLCDSFYVDSVLLNQGTVCESFFL